ncbi:right-handed parallel beta-helix repeat-containing protein [Chryseobacterium oranimense]|uniref:hypothetical protein n=1 Tax=Chryseobacterium oranimense TaxID=421058 RepID=UPI0012DC3FAA|nr:hypothetical protein [Chryseobacterium oranimense]
MSCAQDKIININTFYVKGDDQIDDTAGFDTAIEYIGKNGGTLYIPKGNYYLNNKKRTRKGVYNHSYIFLINQSFNIKLDKEAVLHYANDFKGFRFRSTQDPTSKTINKFNVDIDGGIVDAALNYKTKVKNNPEMWAFVGETLDRFKVTNMIIRNHYGTSGIGAYSNNYTDISDNTFENVTGNPYDYVDNHGNGVYLNGVKSYLIKNNKVINNILETRRLGTVGICIEGSKSGNGTITNNTVTGYDRAIHIELVDGTATIYKNYLIGNSSGVVLWNNNGHMQIVDSNIITNKQLDKQNKPILYTSAPILMLGYETNTGTVIKNNVITIEKDYFIPQNILQITSSDVNVTNNTFSDFSKSLSLSVAQGRGNKERVKGIVFASNKVLGKRLDVYDGSNIDISGNDLNISEMVLSFDNSANVYKKNIVPNEKLNKNVEIFGKYSK